MDLVKKVESLKEKIGNEVENRIKEFEEMFKKDDLSWFHELCFCILTANTSAVMGLKVQKEIGPWDFAKLDYESLREKLRKLGYRFYNTRAKYIVENQKYANSIKSILINKEREERREWLVENIKGMGMKESSHFLRNVGYKDYAIIDKHILKILYENNYINDKKINPKRYIEIEKILSEIADELGMDLARLDLYLWYMETGTILK